MSKAVTVAELRRSPAPAGNDPGVPMPPHVRAQAERADAIQRQINGITEVPPEGTPATPPGEVPTSPPPAPGSTPEIPLAAPPPQLVEPPAPVPPGTQPAPAVAAPAAQTDWERQFHSLNGRYTHDMKQLSERVEQVIAENTRLRAATLAPSPQAAAPTSGAPNPPEEFRLPLTEKEIDEYGPEFVDMMSRVVKATREPLIAQIANLNGRLGVVQNETQQAFVTRMDATIAAAVPNWRAVNNDARFIAWTQLPDIFSGGIRRQLLQEAWNAGDAARVIAFFRSFAAEEAATVPQPTVPQVPPQSRFVVTPAPGVFPQQDPASPHLPAGAPVALESLAAPGRAHSPGAAPTEKPTYTSQDITRFYTDVASGRWKGREEQQRAIDADIIRAQSEGRIIVNSRTQLPTQPF